jgi:hypothetical protein
MKAEKVIYYLLSNHAPLNAIVPSKKINPSVIPLGQVLPAIAYSLVSEVENTANQMTTMVVRSRMQITVAVKGTTPTAYQQVKDIVQKVVDACNHKQGTFNNVVTRSVIRDVVGADFRDDESGVTYSTVDFRIVTVE